LAGKTTCYLQGVLLCDLRHARAAVSTSIIFAPHASAACVALQL
jgi:hypothetical protein